MSHEKKDFNPAFPVDYNPVVLKPASIDQPVQLDPELMEALKATGDSVPDSPDFNPAFPVKGKPTSTKQASIHQEVEPIMDLADDAPSGEGRACTEDNE